MDNIEFKKLPLDKHNIQDYAVSLKVDIKLGDIVYKDAVITIPESSLKHIVWKYETSHSW